MSSIYIFMFAYSPGLGPVPFTYAAEVFPLHIRPMGMASATSITWAFNFLISFSWPKMVETVTPKGGFFLYGGFNILGFIFAYFFVPETKGLTLEELDAVFKVGVGDFFAEKCNRLRLGSKSRHQVSTNAVQDSDRSSTDPLVGKTNAVDSAVKQENGEDMV